MRPARFVRWSNCARVTFVTASCRRVFQDDFAQAFGGADEVLLAPVFRSTLAEDQRLSIPRLVHDLRHRGRAARETGSIDEIIEIVVREHRPGDLVLIMSNGGFDQRAPSAQRRSSGETVREKRGHLNHRLSAMTDDFQIVRAGETRHRAIERIDPINARAILPIV
jgi:hypothetical protein